MAMCCRLAGSRWLGQRVISYTTPRSVTPTSAVRWRPSQDYLGLCAGTTERSSCMSIRSIDHIVILANELEQAIADYTALGFSVVRGGEHPGGATHNALIAFTDGAYLELIAFKQPAERQRWWQLGQRGGEGLVDYAL